MQLVLFLEDKSPKLGTGNSHAFSTQWIISVI